MTIILPTVKHELVKFDRLGRYRKRNIHVYEPTEFEVIRKADPMIIRNGKEFWSIDLDTTSNPGYYSYKLIQFSPEIIDYSCPSNTYYSMPKGVEDIFAHINEPHHPEDVLSRLDRVLRLAVRHTIPTQMIVAGIPNDQLQKILDFKIFLSKIGLGGIATFANIVHNVANGNSTIITDLGKEGFEDEYEKLKEYFESETELYIDSDILEYFPDDEFLEDIVSAMDNTGIDTLLFYK